MEHEAFFKKAIEKLRDLSKSRGIHSVYSGFNEAFRQHFDEDPVKITQQLAQDGKIVTRPVRGGVMIYLPEDARAERGEASGRVLRKILGGDPDPAAAKLEQEEFLKQAIVNLRDLSKSRGIHSVFSGFNQAFREYFDTDPIPVTQRLSEEGKIAVRPVRRGVMLYLPEDAPEARESAGQKALKKILD